MCFPAFSRWVRAATLWIWKTSLFLPICCRWAALCSYCSACAKTVGALRISSRKRTKGEGIKFPHWIRLYMQYILPLIVVIIYLKGYYDMFSGKSTAVFVSWMCFAVLLLFVIFGVSILRDGRRRGK